MDWNKEEERPIPRSKTELQEIATMEFDWLDCPDLAQSEVVNQPIIDTNDLSVSSFNAGHKPSGCKAAADDDSLTTAQASVASTVEG